MIDFKLSVSIKNLYLCQWLHENVCSVSLSLAFVSALEVFSLLQATVSEDEAQKIPEMVWLSLCNLAASGGTAACFQQCSSCCSRLTGHLSLLNEVIMYLHCKQVSGPLATSNFPTPPPPPPLPPTPLLHFEPVQRWLNSFLSLLFCSLHCSSKTPCSLCLGLFYNSPISSSLGC